MTGLFFGDSASPLFGVWTPPASSVDRQHGVVLCPPIGQEHVRTHWALRQVAATLSRTGFHCLRFDWFGVGDSAGTLPQASLRRWRDDLINAVQELRDMAGIDTVSLIGLRMGATLAALATPQVRPQRLLLWDPIVDGNAHVAALHAMTRALLVDPRRYWDLAPSPRVPAATELVGIEVGAALHRELCAIDLRAWQPPARMPVTVLHSDDDAGPRAWSSALAAASPRVSTVDATLRAAWHAPSEIERLLLPGDALRAIAAFMETRPA